MLPIRAKVAARYPPRVLQLMPRRGSAPIADDLSFYVDTRGRKGLRIG